MFFELKVLAGFALLVLVIITPRTYTQRVYLFHAQQEKISPPHVEKIVLPGRWWWAWFNMGMPFEGTEGPLGEHVSKNGYRVKVFDDEVTITTPDGERVTGSIQSDGVCHYFLPKYDGTPFEPEYAYVTCGDPHALRRRLRPYTFDLHP